MKKNIINIVISILSIWFITSCSGLHPFPDEPVPETSSNNLPVGSETVSVNRVTNQSFTDGDPYTSVEWTHEAYDVGGFHDTTNPGRLTAPSAGTYTVSYQLKVGFNINPGPNPVSLRLTHFDSGGSIVSQLVEKVPSWSETYSDAVTASAGDYFELLIEGGNVTVFADESWFGMTKQ